MKNDFRKYAIGHLGMDGLTLDEVMQAQAQYLNPYILEERQLNVTQMDVFSRLMMDRIIFLGTQIDDYTANTLQAQLLYLDSVDSGKDISIYINSPGGSVTAGLGIYDTMQFISSDVATICTGMAASMGAVLSCDDSPASGWCAGSGIGYRDRSKGDFEVQEGTLHHYLRALSHPV